LRGAVGQGEDAVQGFQDGRGTAFASPLTRRLLGWALVLCLGAGVVGLGAWAGDAYAGTTYPLLPVSETRTTRYRGWLAPADSGQLAATLRQATAASDGVTIPEGGIRAGEFVEMSARVRELNGRPVAGASVFFEWASEGGKVHRYSRTADDRGVAQVRRWVGARERGAKTVVIVSVDTQRWSANRYATFVPR
jgi:hypothetical protein